MRSDSKMRNVLMIRVGIGLLALVCIGAAFWLAQRGPAIVAPVEVASEIVVAEKTNGVIPPLRLAADAPVDYNFHVQPILSNNCFACHGFDPNTRESGLRLDTREGATTNYAPEGEAPRFAVVPGSPEESEIWKRINHHNEDLRMPPVESNKNALSSEEKSIIQRWIAQGAEYKTHWSFIPPQKPELPQVTHTQWVRNTIDPFILEKIESLGTTPSPEADKATLIRRVTLDLTGLPPTPEEIDTFLNDTSPDAYEQVVDRLLASPHYGERMALDWLDVARYGDTNAHHVDLERTSWPWRDWVIRAFNENKPYDEFIVEQLAGDLLEEPTRDQILATSFNRNHPITNEGGVIDEEYLVEYATDRVRAVSTAFMGLTMACAHCHDHKYDPFTIDEYYSFLSFFNSIEEIGLEVQDANEAEGYRPYIYIAQSDAEQQLMDESKAALDRLDPAITTDALNEKLRAVTQADPLEWTRLNTKSGKALWNSELVGGPSNQQLRLNLSIDQAERLYAEPGTIAFDLALDEMPADQDVLALNITDLRFNEVGNRRNARDLAGSSKISAIRFQLVRGDQASAQVESELSPQEVWSNASLYGEDAGLRAALDGDDATYWELGASDRSLLLLLRLSEPLPATSKDLRLRVALDFKENSFPLIHSNWGVLFAANSGGRNFAQLAEQVAPFSLTTITPGPVYGRFNDQLKLEWAIAQGKFEAAALAEWAATKDRLFALGKRSVRVAVMQEKAEPTPTFVLNRGAYDAPMLDRPVERIIPAALGEMDPEYPKNRLGLAYWLIEEDNPLTARVTVNRYWQVIFGTGLVATSEDFGAQGELPSHPELLDYLAVHFIESGWDTKALMRKIVTSATYRQQSVYRPEFAEADPENRLLAWFPRQRLPAEFIRDNALAAAGLLVPEIGGPSVKPYQPDGIWREKTMRPDSNTGVFRRDTGEALYRRGMYTFWKQVAPPPQMEAFDAPSREVCVTKRNTTNTPMQALVLLNDETYLEAARALATRLIHELPGPWELRLDDRLVLAYRYLTGERPSAASLAVLRDLTEASFASFSADSEKAAGFLAYGESPLDGAADSVELASLAYTASALLNLDKTITRD